MKRCKFCNKRLWPWSDKVIYGLTFPTHTKCFFDDIGAVDFEQL